MILISDTYKTLYFCGDIHGNWNLILNPIQQYHIHNAVFILCGDVGFGFERLEYYQKIFLPKISKLLTKNHIKIFAFAGNHDDPNFYENELIKTDYLQLLPSYSVLNFKDKNILNVSGGISIDRTTRIYNDNLNIIQYMQNHHCQYREAQKNCIPTYWSNEAVVYKPKVKEHIDIICSHSAPFFCYPTDKGPLVKQYMEYDSKLEEDLRKEREILSNVYNDYTGEVTHWYYGHFHSSNSQTIETTFFKLLNIGEICQYYGDPTYNNIL